MNTTTVPDLETPDDVAKAIERAIELPLSPPAARRSRAAVLADLYMVRARMWHSLGEVAHSDPVIPSVYAQACWSAEYADQGHARFWRRESETR